VEFPALRMGLKPCFSVVSPTGRVMNSTCPAELGASYSLVELQRTVSETLGTCRPRTLLAAPK
jgi:hypothetical protein